MIQEVLARHARAALLVVTDGGAGRMFHRCDNHRLEVFRRLKGIKVIDHLTQVEDHAINRQLRHSARRIGKSHLLTSALLNHRERKAAFFGGIGGASRLGILVKGSNYLEALGSTETVVFDKTGTLTLGLTDGAEQLRPGAAEAVRALRDRGMELWMISGDKREKAERIAGMLGIENVLCEVRPADKSDAVKALQARGKHVYFVGDGINDSPALACADIGVALGCGADIAISTADVMIVSSSMQSVQTVFDVSAATMKNVRQNLIWAAVYNVICIPLAASGIINPSIAAAAMALSSNGVLLNALRLKKYEPRNI